MVTVVDMEGMEEGIESSDKIFADMHHEDFIENAKPFLLEGKGRWRQAGKTRDEEDPYEGEDFVFLFKSSVWTRDADEWTLVLLHRKRWESVQKVWCLVFFLPALLLLRLQGRKRVPSFKKTKLFFSLCWSVCFGFGRQPVIWQLVHLQRSWQHWVLRALH